MSTQQSADKELHETPTLVGAQEQDTQDKRASDHSPLERYTSATSAPGLAAAGGMEMLASPPERKHQYIFARLAREMPLPGTYHYYAMVVMFLAGWNEHVRAVDEVANASAGRKDHFCRRCRRITTTCCMHCRDLLTAVSIIWVFNAVGFFLSGVCNVWLADRLGFGLCEWHLDSPTDIPVAPLGATMQMLGYILMCWGGPYPLFCFAFVLNGFGLGIQDAQVNSIVSRMKGASTLMFLMHAVYGLGATVSPLVSTQFVKHVQHRVYLYYCASLGLAATTTVLLLVVFQMRTDDQVVGYREAAAPGAAVPAVGEESYPAEKAGTTAAQTEAETAAAAKAAEKAATAHQSGSKMKRIVRSPAFWMLSGYIMIYVGVEVTIGGWATSFLVDERGGGNSSGYVSSGFFGGLTVGRVVLIPVTAWIGGWNSVWVYTLLAIALEIIVWTTRSIIGNAIAFSFAGVALGPMYPIVMVVVMDIIPAELQSGAIGVIASIGQVGSAIMPFITGGIAEKHGVWILQPLMVAFMGLSLAIWLFVPRKPVKA